MVQPQSFMVVAAHPDDIEMSCGGTIAKLVAQGATGHYLLITDGEYGGRRCELSPADIASKREQEQREAAKVLGVSQVEFLKKPDGGVDYSQKLRGEIVRWIRYWKPDLVLTHDPRTLILPWGEINHVDHRTVGLLALDAIYPFARGRLLYRQQLTEEGLSPHAVKDVLLWDTEGVNHTEDISAFMDAKVQSVSCHSSQFPNISPVSRWIHDHASATGKQHLMRFAESFQHIDLRPVF